MATKKLTDEQKKARKEARDRVLIDLGAEFRAMRVSKGYTLVELAKILDVHDKTVSYWERGKGKIPGDKMMVLKELPDHQYERERPQNAPRKPRQSATP